MQSQQRKLIKIKAKVKKIKRKINSTKILFLKDINTIAKPLARMNKIKKRERRYKLPITGMKRRH